MFFSVTSSLLGLASVSYYANTGAASWDVYWSSRYYLIISSATCLFAIVQVITGVVAGIYSCLAFGDDTQSEQVGTEGVMSWLALRVLVCLFVCLFFFFYQSRVEILTNLRVRFVFHTFVANIGERETRVTGDEAQGTKGRGEKEEGEESLPFSPSRLPLRAN